MNDENLRQLLAQVHERLSNNATSLDAQSRALLTTVMHDIERTLARNDAAATSAAAPRLESLAVEFQAEHPALAGTLRQLIDALGKAGI